MLDQSGSKFSVEPRSQNSESSQMCQIPIWELQIQFPGLNINLNFQVTAAATTTSQELSQSGKSPDPSRPGTKYPIQEIPHFHIDFPGDLNLKTVIQFNGN